LNRKKGASTDLSGLVKVSSLEKRNEFNIVKPIWIQDCIRQAEIDVDARPFMLPFEPNRHMHHLTEKDQEDYEDHVDDYGDSYTRDFADVDELRQIIARMPKKFDSSFEGESFRDQLEVHGHAVQHFKSYIFSNMTVCFAQCDDAEWALRSQLAQNYILFGGGTIVSSKKAKKISHMVMPKGQHAAIMDVSLTEMSRSVGVEWVEKCWEEGTRVDEERFQWG
jgi:DNA ligase 4